MDDSVEAAVSMHLHAILSVWDCDSEICKRDSGFQVHLNLRIRFKLLAACLLKAH
jgi:hypothetical protein